MGEIVYIAPEHFRRAPRVPRYRAPIVYGSAGDVLAALGVTLIGLAVVTLCWAPFILAGIWLCRRLHGAH